MEELQTGISQLNDDCLVEIFSRLKLNDQLVLTDVSSCFRNIVKEYILKASFKTFQTNLREIHKISRSKFKKLFALASDFIEELEILDMSHFMFSSYLGRHREMPDLGFFFCFDMPNLRKLICRDKSYHDGHSKLLLQKCPNLEELIIFSPHITGNYIKNLKNLHVLKAAYSDLDAEHLNDLLPKLTHLQIHDIRNISSLKFQQNKTLKYLMFSPVLLNTSFAQHLNSFECLERLGVSSICSSVPNELETWIPFDNYVKSHTKKIEIIYLRMNLTFMTFLRTAKWLPDVQFRFHIKKIPIEFGEILFQSTDHKAKIFIYSSFQKLIDVHVTLNRINELIQNKDLYELYIVKDEEKKLSDDEELSFNNLLQRIMLTPELKGLNVKCLSQDASRRLMLNWNHDEAQRDEYDNTIQFLLK